jgi:hypothetical protein
MSRAIAACVAFLVLKEKVMSSTLCEVVLCAAVVFVEVGVPLKDTEKIDRGKVASVAVGKLVMTDSEGKNEHAYVVPAEAKVMLNDQEAKLTDLKAGDAVTVTIGMEGEVITVAAKRTKSPAGQRGHLRPLL